uniref:Immunoglobulin V-set domain-containing protein n=1 Tax=Oryctolagus cuniculus TaxID=9986 RepID=G1TXZ7_RABIT
KKMNEMLFCPLSQNNFQLEESGGGLVNPGGSLTLTSSGFSLSSYGVSWVRQAPGKGLEWIRYISISGSAYYASWVNGPFTISKTSSPVDLKMTSLTASNTATYFCARNTVRGPHTEPKHQTPARARGSTRGRTRRTERIFWSCTGAEGDEVLVSCQELGFALL